MVAQASHVPSSFDRALAAGNWPARRPDGVYVIASSSHPGMDHELRVTEDGLTCSCEAGRFGRPDCKHRAALRYCLLHGIIGRYVLCSLCARTRVAKHGAVCSGCQSLASVAQQNDARLQEPDGGFLNLPIDFDGRQRRVPFVPVNPLEEMFL